MFTITEPIFPKMPEILDFQKVNPDPAWVSENYQKALERWQKVCDDMNENIRLHVLSK